MRSETSATLTALTRIPPASEQLATSFRDLPAALESVRDARTFIRTTLRQWALPELFDDVALVASELVTNALRHGVTPGAAPAVRLSLGRWTSRLVCSVRDPSSSGPVVGDPDFSAESGRGLRLIASCSVAWGWHPLAGAGKVVWALFPVPDAPDARRTGG